MQNSLAKGHQVNAIKRRTRPRNKQKIQLGEMDNLVVAKADARAFRPAEVETLLDDPAKIGVAFDWVQSISVDELISKRVRGDLKNAAHPPHRKARFRAMKITSGIGASNE